MSYVRIVLAALLALLLWTTLVAGGALYGWWRSPLAPAGDADAFLAAAAARLRAGNGGDAALLLIEDGRVHGARYASAGSGVNGDTLFPVASLSKWIAACAVMTLVQDGRVELDAPVSRYLTRWQLPAGPFDPDGVTARRLLSHTAGLTDGLGFADYGSDEIPPPLLDSLAAPRASSGQPVRIEAGIEPGSEWRYSGGGYLVLELLVEEVSGRPFADYVEDAVFGPFGMQRAGYGYAGDLDDVAGIYTADGRRIPPFRYASNAATGLLASPTDLARLLMGQVSGSGPLDAQTLAAMRRPHGRLFGADIWGLGTMLYAPLPDGAYLVGHDGANEPAINSAARLNPLNGDGIVVLSTGNASLASSLGSEWVFWQSGRPDFLAATASLRDALPVLLGGWLLIIIIALATALLRRRRRNIRT